MKPCLDCGTPTPATRCRTCAANRERTRRPPPNQRGYTADYRSQRAALLADHPPCAMQLNGCTGPATTAQHTDLHTPGDRLGPLIPACHHCNSADGAKRSHG